MTAHIKTAVAQRAKVPPIESPFGTLAAVERATIDSTLMYFDHDKPRAANALGISLRTLYNKLNEVRNG